MSGKSNIDKVIFSYNNVFNSNFHIMVAYYCICLYLYIIHLYLMQYANLILFWKNRLDKNLCENNVINNYLVIVTVFSIKKQSLTNAKIFRQKLNYKLRLVSYYVEIVKRCTAVRDLSCMFWAMCAYPTIS